jgi:hypothetical protein
LTVQVEYFPDTLVSGCNGTVDTFGVGFDLLFVGGFVGCEAQFVSGLEPKVRQLGKAERVAQRPCRRSPVEPIDLVAALKVVEGHERVQRQ